MNGLRANDGKHTRRGDLPSGLHDNIKEVFNFRPVISKVVRSGDGCIGINSRVRDGS